MIYSFINNNSEIVYFIEDTDSILTLQESKNESGIFSVVLMCFDFKINVSFPLIDPYLNPN